MPTRKRPGLVSFLLLLGAGLLVYGKALSAGFLNFDDNLYFGPDNPEFQSGLGAVFDPSRPIANAWLPVSHLSLWLDFAVTRETGSAFWPHLHSLLVHVVAAWALARLCARLSLPVWPATGVALVFALHPALAESVAWVSGRKDLLSGLFTFLCLSSVLEHAQHGGRWRLLWAGLLALLALHSKGTAVVLVLMAPLVLRLNRLPLGPAAWLVATLAIASGVHHATVAAAQGTMQSAVGGRLLGVPGAFLHYFATIFWPASLNVLYPEALTLEVFRARLVAGSLALLGAGVLVAFCLTRERLRPCGFGLLLAFAALLPFNTAWPASAIAAADRYLYLAVPWVAFALLGPLPARTAFPLAAALSALLGPSCAQRAQAFRSSEALWEASLRAAPRNAVASVNLALAISGKDRDRARRLAEQARADARHPTHELSAVELLRELAWQAGRLQEACRAADDVVAICQRLEGDAVRQRHVQAGLRAIELHEGSGKQGEARQRLAALRASFPHSAAVLVYATMQDVVDALGEGRRLPQDHPVARRARADLERLLAAEPGFAPAWIALAGLERAQGNLMAARRAYERARRLAPRDPQVYLGWADLLLEQELYREAREILDQGRAAGAHDPNLLARLGQAIVGSGGNLAEAERIYESYLQIRNDDRAVRRLLAEVVAVRTLPRLAQAEVLELEQAARRIRELEPTHPRADHIQAAALHRRRDFGGAVALIERAREKLPADADLRRFHAEALRDRGYQLLLQDPRSEEALDLLRRFVDLAPAEVPTEAARTALQSAWQRVEREGVAAFRSGDRALAERCFRLCLRLLPEEGFAHHQLGLVLFGQGGDQLGPALQSFRDAEAALRKAGADPGLPILYQVMCLRQLERIDEARAKAEAYLAEVGETEDEARAETLRRLRAELARVGR